MLCELKITIKRTISFFKLPVQRNNRKLILIYHSVGNYPDALNKDLFVEQMKWLKENCHVVSIEYLLNSLENKNKKPMVAITFDDGYSSVYKNVMPVFESLNFTATVYINTDWIAQEGTTRKNSVRTLGHYGNESFLNWAEVKELHKHGWIIGSHGANHLDHTKLESKTLNYELSQSKSKIEENLSINCLHFAYTWGKHNHNLCQAVKTHGYMYAVAGHHKILKKNVDSFAIPRMSICKEYSLKDFSSIIKGRWDYLGWYHAIKKHVKNR